MSDRARARSSLNVESAYGPIRAIRGVSLQVAQGRDRHRARLQRRRQDDDPEDDLRHHRSAQGQRRVRGRRHHRARTRPTIVQRGLSHVPEGREVFPLLSVHDNLLMGAYTRSDRDARGARHGGGLRLLPDPARTRARRMPGCSRAASSRCSHLARPDGRAADLILLDEPSLGLSPQPHARDLRDRRAHQPRARHDHPAGRAERATWRSTSPTTATCSRTAAS